jgi:hypothetical protein
LKLFFQRRVFFQESFPFREEREDAVPEFTLAPAKELRLELQAGHPTELLH